MDDYSGQFGESEKLIDEANLMGDLIELLENLWSNANYETKREFKTDYENLMKKVKKD